MVLTVGSRSHLLRAPGTEHTQGKQPRAQHRGARRGHGHSPRQGRRHRDTLQQLSASAGTQTHYGCGDRNVPEHKAAPRAPGDPPERDCKTKQGAEKGKKGDPAYGSNSYGMARVSRTAPKSSTSAEGTRRICFPKHKAKP